MQNRVDSTLLQMCYAGPMMQHEWKFKMMQLIGFRSTYQPLPSLVVGCCVVGESLSESGVKIREKNYEKQKHNNIIYIVSQSDKNSGEKKGKLGNKENCSEMHSKKLQLFPNLGGIDKRSV